jgi:hypothetical protein
MSPGLGCLGFGGRWCHVNHRDEAALVIEVAVGLRFEGAPLATARHAEAEDDQPRQGVAPIVVML